jgi:preprotein translocase subunit SecE
MLESGALAGKESIVAKVQEKNKASKELGIIRYLRETRAELRKVTWPTQKEALNLTYIVLGVTFAFAVVLGVLDWIFSQIFQLLF